MDVLWACRFNLMLCIVLAIFFSLVLKIPHREKDSPPNPVVLAGEIR